MAGFLVAAEATGSEPRKGIPAQIKVDVDGTGDGKVTSVPSGISCPDKCIELGEAGTEYTLTAKPASGSVFAGFEGNNFPCDSSTPTTCTFTAQPGSNSFSAVFNRAGGGKACDKAKAKLAKAKSKLAKLKANGASDSKIRAAKNKVKRAKEKKNGACA